MRGALRAARGAGISNPTLGRAIVAVMTLSLTMGQEAMDSFIKSLGATDNPFTVEDLFEGRKNEV